MSFNKNYRQRIIFSLIVCFCLNGKLFANHFVPNLNSKKEQPYPHSESVFYGDKSFLFYKNTHDWKQCSIIPSCTAINNRNNVFSSDRIIIPMPDMYSDYCTSAVPQPILPKLYSLLSDQDPDDPNGNLMPGQDIYVDPDDPNDNPIIGYDIPVDKSVYFWFIIIICYTLYLHRNQT